MFSVTGLEFSFTQAPDTMKSVLQACWLLAVAFGNIIVVIVAKTHFFESQASEFFLFFGLMCIDVCIFIWLAMRYRYREDIEAEQATRNGTMPMGNLPQNFVSDATKRHSIKQAGIENKAYTSDVESLKLGQ